MRKRICRVTFNCFFLTTGVSSLVASCDLLTRRRRTLPLLPDTPLYFSRTACNTCTLSSDKPLACVASSCVSCCCHARHLALLLLI